MMHMGNGDEDGGMSWLTKRAEDHAETRHEQKQKASEEKEWESIALWLKDTGLSIQQIKRVIRQAIVENNGE